MKNLINKTKEMIEMKIKLMVSALIFVLSSSAMAGYERDSQGYWTWDSPGVSGSSYRMGDRTHYKFDNGVSGSSYRMGDRTHYEWNR
jgi:hypothetical protein